MRTFTRRRSGFSLIEVAMAIAITAFAAVAIVGLVPIGMDSFQQTKNVSISSQISQQIFSELVALPFSKLTPTSGNTMRLIAPDGVNYVRYFDDQGDEVTSTASNAVYQVNVRGTKPYAVPFSGSLPFDEFVPRHPYDSGRSESRPPRARHGWHLDSMDRKGRFSPKLDGLREQRGRVHPYLYLPDDDRAELICAAP